LLSSSPAGDVTIAVVMSRATIVVGALLALSLTACGTSAKNASSSTGKSQPSPQGRQALRLAQRQLDEISGELQSIGDAAGADTSGCRPRSSLVGCYVANPVAFRFMVSAYARLRLAAQSPDVSTAAECHWAGLQMDCLVSAYSHGKTSSSHVRVSTTGDFVITRMTAS
jgi:hypothetical protein